MFLIRVIPTEGSERRPVIYFEDMGEANALFDHSGHTFTQLNAFLFNNLRPQVAYRPELGATVSQFRNRWGAQVPICFKMGRSRLGIIPILDQTSDLSAVRSAQSFIQSFPDSKVLLVHSGSADRVIDKRIGVVGAAQIL